MREADKAELKLLPVVPSELLQPTHELEFPTTAKKKKALLVGFII